MAESRPGFDGHHDDASDCHFARAERAVRATSSDPPMQAPAPRAVDLSEPAVMEWCPRPDSNRHSSQNRILNPARLPIPPLGHGETPNSGVIKTRNVKS